MTGEEDETTIELIFTIAITMWVILLMLFVYGIY